MIQLDLFGKCAHLHTQSNNCMSSNARLCTDCGDFYVSIVCRNNIHDYGPIPV